MVLIRVVYLQTAQPSNFVFQNVSSLSLSSGKTEKLESLEAKVEYFLELSRVSTEKHKIRLLLRFRW